MAWPSGDTSPASQRSGRHLLPFPTHCAFPPSRCPFVQESPRTSGLRLGICSQNFVCHSNQVRPFHVVFFRPVVIFSPELCLLLSYLLCFPWMILLTPLVPDTPATWSFPLNQSSCHRNFSEFLVSKFLDVFRTKCLPSGEAHMARNWCLQTAAREDPAKSHVSELGDESSRMTAGAGAPATPAENLGCSLWGTLSQRTPFFWPRNHDTT